MQEKEQLHEQEIASLNEDLYSVEELEERLELAATAIANALVVPFDLCGANACGGDVGW